jgi:calcineurin-like phosphoesterase
MAALASFLPPLLSRWTIDLAIVNGENSAYPRPRDRRESSRESVEQ